MVDVDHTRLNIDTIPPGIINNKMIGSKDSEFKIRIIETKDPIKPDLCH